MGEVKEFVSHLIKYNAQTTGRDKICRLVQYTSKFLKWYWTQYGIDKDLVKKCQNLEGALGSTRKAIRIGKSLDMLQGAITSLKIDDSFIRRCLVLSKLSMAGYLFVDHFIWAAKLDLIRSDAKRLARTASWFWLAAILSNLARNFYDISVIVRAELRRRKRVDQQKGISRGAVADGAGRYGPCGIVARVLDDRPVVVDTLKNAADVFLPLATLELFKTSEGFQGLMGMVSSYMGLLATWNPALKLVPA